MTTQNSLPVLQCTLSNGAHPEYGQATVPFPIPAGDYGRTLELLAGMGLGDPLNRDCRVDELHSGFPILKRLEKVGANLDEMDSAGQLYGAGGRPVPGHGGQAGDLRYDGFHQPDLLLPAGHGDHGLLRSGADRT